MKLLSENIDRKGCALITAYNAALWSGCDIPYKTVYENARAWCGFKNNGLKISKMSTLFNSMNIPAKRVRKNSPLHKVIASMFDGKAVVFAYTDVGGGEGHAVLVTPDFKIVNPDKAYRKWSDLFLAICDGKVRFNAWIVGKQ